MISSTHFPLNSALNIWILLSITVNYSHESESSPLSKANTTLHMNRLNTEEPVIPYLYFDFCPINEKNSNKIEILKEIQCEKVCTHTYRKNDPESQRRMDTLKKGMSLNYQHHLIVVDNKPAAWCYVSAVKKNCSIEFPMGCYFKPHSKSYDRCLISSRYIKPGYYYPFNHVNLTITYRSGVAEKSDVGIVGGSIVSVEIEPASINHANGKLDCSANTDLLAIPAKTDDHDINITYTNSVKFVQDNTVQIHPDKNWHPVKQFELWEPRIQWFSIFNSLVIVIFLSGMVAMIMRRKLQKDIARYNQMDRGEDEQEEFGWKLVHGDVFRPPCNGMLLSIFLGSGAQVFCMTLVTIAFTSVGLLSPTDDDALIRCELVLYVLLSTPAGYISARIYKSFGGIKWKTNALLTSTLCTGVVFGLFFIINLVVMNKHSRRAVPFSTLVEWLALWLVVSVPLQFVGAYLEFRKPPLEHPVRTNEIPRKIPDQSIYTQPIPSIIIGGFIPFGCTSIPLFFIMESVLSMQINLVFGFFLLIFCILVITCSETAIVPCYFHLCAEDYHWWWRSFLTSGCTAFYLFIYCCYFYAIRLSKISNSALTFSYFGYTLILAILFFLMTGTIGFMACFGFIRKIYSVVKIEFRKCEKEKNKTKQNKTKTKSTIQQITIRYNNLINKK